MLGELIHTLNLGAVSGGPIFIPATNLPAVAAARRLSTTSTSIALSPATRLALRRNNCRLRQRRSVSDDGRLSGLCSRGPRLARVRGWHMRISDIDYIRNTHLPTLGTPHPRLRRNRRWRRWRAVIDRRAASRFHPRGPNCKGSALIKGRTTRTRRSPRQTGAGSAGRCWLPRGSRWSGTPS